MNPNFGIGPMLPSMIQFQSEDEWRYFQSYSGKVAFQLAGVFDSTLWSTLILQACEQDNSVLHAVVAIGALQKALEVKDYTVGIPNKSESEIHYQFAVNEYGKAISYMRTTTGAVMGPPNLRSTLITSLLIICFEAFHGNYFSALAQIHIALRLLEDWAKTLKPGPHSPSGICRLYSDGTGFPFDIRSPSPGVIEDELILAFSRVNLQSLAFVDTQSVRHHRLASRSCQATIDQMPRQFSTLEQARAYSDLVERRIMRFSLATGMGQDSSRLSGTS
jgi:hypothetical protein